MCVFSFSLFLLPLFGFGAARLVHAARSRSHSDSPYPAPDLTCPPSRTRTNFNQSSFTLLPLSPSPLYPLSFISLPRHPSLPRRFPLSPSLTLRLSPLQNPPNSNLSASVYAILMRCFEVNVGNQRREPERHPPLRSFPLSCLCILTDLFSASRRWGPPAGCEMVSLLFL
ncbi:hypothetical protein C8R47DRAFT_1164184 [Mycena vitilis]|nr:hypothetical protein C8R47DRAFT_1164184 [Mycena vitilis]